MPHCAICNTECFEPARHLDVANHRPHTAEGTPSNEFAPDDSGSAFCYQCSRDFATPAALSAHLSDALVHSRAYPSLYESSYSGGSYAFSRSPSPRAHRERALGYTSSPTSTSTHSSHSISNQGEHASYEGQEDRTRLYDANHGSSYELSSEEAISDDDGDISMDASSYDNNHDNNHERNPDSRNYRNDTDPTAHAERQRDYTHTTEAAPPSRPYTYGEHSHVQPIAFEPDRSRIYASTRATHHKNDSVPGMRTGTRRSYSETSSPPRRASTSNPRPRPHPIVCPICLDPAAEATSTLCGHIFCASCIKAALRIREACPVCNRAVGQWTPHPIYPVFELAS